MSSLGYTCAPAVGRRCGLDQPIAEAARFLLLRRGDAPFQRGQQRQEQQTAKTLQRKLVAIPSYVLQAPQGGMQNHARRSQGSLGLVVTDESILRKISPGEEEQISLQFT